MKIRTCISGSTPRFQSLGVLLFAAFCLCGCATSYHPDLNGKGYTESQISTNEFQIGFQGNSRTTVEHVYDFALLRSSEVVLHNGYHFFAVMDAANTSSAKSYIAHQRYYVKAAADSGFGLPTPSGYLVDVREPRVDFQPGALLRIKCFADKPAKPFTYDAAELKAALRKKNKLGE